MSRGVPGNVAPPPRMRAMLLSALLLLLLAADARRVSLSGQSAGGSMAIQHLVAFSSNVDGAAIAGGSPYGCGSVRFRFTECYTGGINLGEVIQYLRDRFDEGIVDDPRYLSNVSVILFSGKGDYLVLPEVMRETADQLAAFVPAAKLTRVFNTSAGHVWSVDHGPCKCGACGFGGYTACCDINNCGYDLAGDILRKSYGPLRPRVKARKELYWVDQRAYVPSPTGEIRAEPTRNPTASPAVAPAELSLLLAPSPSPTPSARGSTLLDRGIVYVSTGCEARLEQCRVHINYHGCMGDDWREREQWVRSLDLNKYAEANDLIVVYPQAAGDQKIGQGCWNWASYVDDPYFDTRRGIQLGTVHALVEDLPNALRAGIVTQGARAYGSVWDQPRWHTGSDFA